MNLHAKQQLVIGLMLILLGLLGTGCGSLEVGVEPAGVAEEGVAVAVLSPTATAPLPEVTASLVNRSSPAESILTPAAVGEEATTPTSPEAVTTAFYRWYLDYIGDRSSGEFRNPLVDQAYHQSDLLTPGFIHRVDEIIASFDKSGYDPFLCAQDIPGAITTSGVFVGSPTARVVAQTDFHHHFFTVELEMVQPQQWRINDVTCAVTPEGVTKGFYTWYLSNTGRPQNAPEQMDLFLTPTFKAQLEGWTGAYDPVLLAQDVPQSFNLMPGATENKVIVREAFGPESMRDLQVTLQQVNGRWLIDNIEEAPAEQSSLNGTQAADVAWKTFVSDEYGYSFAYPAGWTVQAIPLGGPDGPPLEPIVQILQVMPPDVAAALTDRSGPPDPTAPVIVSPFNVEVSLGSPEALARQYPPPLGSEETTFNGYPVTVERTEPGIVRYLFRHPDNPELRVAITDWVSEFAGREEAAQRVEGILPPLLSSFTFSN